MIAGKKFLYYSGRVIAPLAIVAAGIGGLMVLGQRPDPPTRPPDATSGVMVETNVAQEFAGTFDIEVEGVAVSYRRVTYSAEVAGRVTYASPSGRGGEYVERGTRLFEIDQTDYALDVQRLQAQLAQAQANLAEAAFDITSTESLIALARRTGTPAAESQA